MVLSIIGIVLGIIAIGLFVWLKQEQEMNKESWLGVLRHALTFGGGFLTQAGLADGDQVTTGVSAVVTLVGLVWSILNKRK